MEPIYDYDDETRLFVLDHEEAPYAQLHPEEELDEELLLELARPQQSPRRRRVRREAEALEMATEHQTGAARLRDVVSTKQVPLDRNPVDSVDSRATGADSSG